MNIFGDIFGDIVNNNKNSNIVSVVFSKHKHVQVV
jgi:hypothetical protein